MKMLLSVRIVVLNGQLRVNSVLWVIDILNQNQMTNKPKEEFEGYCHNCMVGSGIVNVSKSKCRCSCHKPKEEKKMREE